MDTHPLNLPEELNQRRQIILRELRKRTLWFIQLRWLVPPSILAATGAGYLIGHVVELKFSAPPLLLIAVFMLAYNSAFYLWSQREKKGPGWRTGSLLRFAYSQVVLDYIAMFLLIHFTGGAASPCIFFFIFHIIFAAILLPPRSAYGFAVLAAAGMAVIAAAEYYRVLLPHPILFMGHAIDLARQPFHVMVELSFFTASVLITAFSTTTIMPIFRKRIQNLAELSETVVDINSRLQALYVITKTISSTTRYQQIWDIVTSELAAVMNVQGISIKLASEDRQQLAYAAAYGLPASFKDKVVEVAKSPINRRILEGEPYVIGDLTRQEEFQFGEDLTAAGVKSVLFVPLLVEGKVNGILGAYSNDLDRFGVDELDFFRLAAGLLAVALENARAFEAIEKLNKERLWFMMRVAHNLRSPLTTNQSIMNMVLEGYLGELTPDQRSYLERISERSQAMLATLSELTTLAETRNEKRQAAYVLVDLREVARRLREAYQEEAAKKEINFILTLPEDLPVIHGDPEMLEQMLENLISNAIKYTRQSGRVSLDLSRSEDNQVKIVVSDTGIGIPAEAMSRLFTEFFRAENAKAVAEMGTGLGLAIVRDIILQHQGRITVDSEEGKGTTFTVLLPVASKKEAT